MNNPLGLIIKRSCHNCPNSIQSIDSDKLRCVWKRRDEEADGPCELYGITPEMHEEAMEIEGVSDV